MEQINCALCDSSRSSVLYHRPPSPSADNDGNDYYATTDRFDRYGTVVRCDNCGLVFANPRPASSVLYHGYQTTADQEYAEESSSRSINAHISLHTIKKHIKSGALLDVGCATGYFLNAARTDFNGEGVELSAWACNNLISHFHLPVHEGDLASAHFEEGHFDVVTMIDVIEHLTDPVSVLREANRILKPAGILYLVTPNIKSLSSWVMGKRWWGLRLAHLYYFSPETMRILLEKTGFSIIEQKSFGRIFTYKYWLSRIRNYSSFTYSAIELAIKLLHFSDKFVYLNTRDSMEIVARKK